MKEGLLDIGDKVIQNNTIYTVIKVTKTKAFLKHPTNEHYTPEIKRNILANAAKYGWEYPTQERLTEVRATNHLRRTQAGIFRRIHLLCVHDLTLAQCECLIAALDTIAGHPVYTGDSNE